MRIPPSTPSVELLRKMTKSRVYPEVECATVSCATVFTQTGNRQKYCLECKVDRKRAAYKDWYDNRGGCKHLKKKYKANSKECLAKAKVYYFENGGKEKRLAYSRTEKGRLIAKHCAKRRNVRRVQVRREKRIAEMKAGGRTFPLRTAPTSGPYLTGIADYQGSPPKIRKPVMMKPVVDPYDWDGTFRT